MVQSPQAQSRDCLSRFFQQQDAASQSPYPFEWHRALRASRALLALCDCDGCCFRCCILRRGAGHMRLKRAESRLSATHGCCSGLVPLPIALCTCDCSPFLQGQAVAATQAGQKMSSCNFAASDNFPLRALCWIQVATEVWAAGPRFGRVRPEVTDAHRSELRRAAAGTTARSKLLPSKHMQICLAVYYVGAP